MKRLICYFFGHREECSILFTGDDYCSPIDHEVWCGRCARNLLLERVNLQIQQRGRTEQRF